MTTLPSHTPPDHFHFMGIGGFGISAIARVMYEMGYTISGCDMNDSPLLEFFRSENIPIDLEHSETHLTDHTPSALVVSSAIPEDNVEIKKAYAEGIPVYKRSDILGFLMQDRHGITVAGTHGKTTTTAMISYLLTRGGKAPSYIIGGVAKNLSTNAHAGVGSAFVIEADEYDGMFLGLKPQIAILTSLEMDHPDMFADIHEVRELFKQFLELLPDDGLLVANTDSEETQVFLKARQASELPVIGYGFNFRESDWFAENVRLNDDGYTQFTVRHGRHKAAEIVLQIPGKHNISNALAAIAVGDTLGIPPTHSAEILAKFEGIGRRFDIIGVERGITIVDDYAHHPTAIWSTLEGARFQYPSSKIWAVWQPHTYSRTQALLDDFVQCFSFADEVIVTDIYRSRDTETFGITPESIVKAIEHDSVQHVSGMETVATYLHEYVRTGDVVIVMSAGSAVQISAQLLKMLKNA